MFSLFPAMLEVSMVELAPDLPLREKIREALVGALSRDGSLLMWAERYEHGDWLRCDAIAQSYGLNQEELVRCFQAAVIWAEGTLHLAF
jgi:c-di-GMP-related signal transduction protein